LQLDEVSSLSPLGLSYRGLPASFELEQPLRRGRQQSARCA
jgi:hypothetical protein